MQKKPVWPLNLTTIPTYPKLEKSIEVDVAIIGAGITGLTAAMQLIDSDKSIAIVEADTIGSGTTGYSTANLYVPVQSYYQQLSTKFNKQTAAIIAQSRKAAIDYIERVTTERAINCQFQRRPWYMFTKLTENNAKVEHELEALNQCGMAATFAQELPFDTPFTKAIKLDGQARFNPLQYLYGLTKILTTKGCQIYEHSRVIDYHEHKDHCEVTTEQATVKARKLIMATHIPIGINALQLKVYPYRSYAAAAQLADNHYPSMIMWHIDEPHFSISTHNVTAQDIDLLIVAGNHHKTGQPSQHSAADHMQITEAYLTSNFNISTLDYAWSAQHYQPADGLPYLGLASRLTKHSYVATGYSADGLTYGTLAGLVLADLVLGKDNLWSKIYKSTRFTPKASAKRMVRENINVLGRYLADYPRNVEASDYLAIKRGEGKIIEEKAEKWAVYRSEEGELRIVSAICPHMKCVVKFNDAEKTWDCPCHGSRFTTEGQVIEGPALSPLKPKFFHHKEEGKR